MAKKKEPSLEDSLNNFKDVITRMELTTFFRVNNVLISKTPSDISIVITMDKELWTLLMNDEEFVKTCKEIDVSDPEEFKLNEFVSYIEDTENWIDINCEDLYKGSIVEIKVDTFDYGVSINKSSIPIKLKKTEFNNISYKIFTKPKLVLCLKKKFDGCVENSSFTIMRMYQIL